MPAGSDCQGCHITEAGTLGTREIPVMAHPLWGWRDCTACHSTGSLVASAPGHSSLHKDDCLVCHQTRTETGDTSEPPLRPEHMGTDKPCIACHGIDEHAPLPEAMAGRENCWICHNGEEFTYLFEEQASERPCADRRWAGRGDRYEGHRLPARRRRHSLIRLPSRPRQAGTGSARRGASAEAAVRRGPSPCRSAGRRPARRRRAARCARTRSSPTPAGCPRARPSPRRTRAPRTRR